MAKRRFTPEEAVERHRLRAAIHARNKREQLRRNRVPYEPYEVHKSTDFTRPPEEVLADREYRMSLPRPIFGDPPRGYSMLDKRR